MIEEKRQALMEEQAEMMRQQLASTSLCGTLKDQIEAGVGASAKTSSEGKGTQ